MPVLMLSLLGCIACIAQMQPVATDDARSVICLCVYLSVCLCVAHTDVPCRNGWIDRDAIWGADLGWPKKPWFRWGL